MKLKTLNDFATPMNMESTSNNEAWIINDLKGMARRWITYLDSGGNNGLETEELSHGLGEVVTAQEWIKHFFNLEEDNGL